MNDESNQLLRQLIDAQNEHTELLRKHVLPLWTRIRFSLLALLLIMTMIATGVGFTVLAVRPGNAPAPARPTGATYTWMATPDATLKAAPNGTLEVWSATPMGAGVPSLASPVVSP
jgi:hypothetical protein